MPSYNTKSEYKATLSNSTHLSNIIMLNEVLHNQNLIQKFKQWKEEITDYTQHEYEIEYTFVLKQSKRTILPCLILFLRNYFVQSKEANHKHLEWKQTLTQAMHENIINKHFRKCKNNPVQQVMMI